jgi:phosphoglycerate dehydrogenase-like enzyme
MPEIRDKRRAAFSMEPGLATTIFDAGQMLRLHDHLDFSQEQVDVEGQRDVSDVEILVTGWGAEPIAAPELDRMPALRAIFHSGGTVRPFLTREVWDRGILVTTASAANALPVAEFTLASILFAGKDVFTISRQYSANSAIDLSEHRFAGLGNYRQTVGIVGASQIGRRVVELLRPFDVTILLSDPYLDPTEAAALGVTAVTLHELFRRSTVVSLHAPLIPSTRGMVTAELLDSMVPGATLINTARGGLIDQDALVRVLQAERIHAVLDVTEPEPLPAGHPLWHLPNVVLTPHLAGARGNELHRLGESVVREAKASTSGLPPARPFSLSDLEKSA